MANLLIVEDTTERIDNFTDNLGDCHSLTFAKSALKGIKLLRERTFDAIFLDYDLGPWCMNGADVASCMFHSRNSATPVWVHSWNPGGADEIVKILETLPHRLGASTVKYMYISTLSELNTQTEFWVSVREWLNGLNGPV